ADRAGAGGRRSGRRVSRVTQSLSARGSRAARRRAWLRREHDRAGDGRTKSVEGEGGVQPGKSRETRKRGRPGRADRPIRPPPSRRRATEGGSNPASLASPEADAGSRRPRDPNPARLTRTPEARLRGGTRTRTTSRVPESAALAPRRASDPP